MPAELDPHTTCDTCGTHTGIDTHCCGRCAEDSNDRDQARGRARIDRRRRANGLAPLAPSVHTSHPGGARFGTPDNERVFSLVVRKRWVLVAEHLGGQRTARWFRDKETGAWHLAESWKRPKPWRMMEGDALYLMELLGRQLPADEPGRELVTL